MKNRLSTEGDFYLLSDVRLRASGIFFLNGSLKLDHHPSEHRLGCGWHGARRGRHGRLASASVDGRRNWKGWVCAI